jgi:hypothetical protein
MKRFVLFLLCVAFCLPVLLKSETLYLKDGSSVKGRIVKTENDTVYFETSFGASIRIPKDKVARIDFEGVLPQTQPQPDSTMRSVEEPGTLLVSFDDFQLTSRIVMKRRGDKSEYERENSIEQALFVGEKKVFSAVDSTTDKIVRQGPETVLRNDAKPVEMRVPVTPGVHQCTIVIGNTRASLHVDSFDPSPLSRRLVLDGIGVVSKQTTALRVGLKRKAWRIGKSELVRITD